MSHKTRTNEAVHSYNAMWEMLQNRKTGLYDAVFIHCLGLANKEKWGGGFLEGTTSEMGFER